jgi:hypothetical protein
VAFIISAIFRPPPRQVAEGFFTMLRGLGWPYAHQSPRGGSVLIRFSPLEDPFLGTSRSEHSPFSVKVCVVLIYIVENRNFFRKSVTKKEE